MSRRLYVVMGVALIVVGAVWTLQGLGVIGGSPMSGVKLWAAVGPFVALLGVVLTLGGRGRTDGRR